MAYWDPEDNFSDLNYDNEYKSNITVPGPELYNRLPSMRTQLYISASLYILNPLNSCL